MIEVLALLLMAAGVFFFAVGGVALLRFPDTPTRIHALTKADNLGLGLLSLGLALQAGDPAGAGVLVVIWLLVLSASAPLASIMIRLAVHREKGDSES